MKVSLIVASGVHQGKSIPVAVPRFLIGRDPSCQLRPASQAVSKQHCAIIVKDGKVFITDFGSTNGTTINGTAVPADSEVEAKHGDRIVAGPLDFTLNLALPKPSDQTPLPDVLKPVASAAGQKLGSAAGVKPASAAGVKPVSKPVAPAKPGSEDDMAALLLGMDESDPQAPSSTDYSIPEGSTIMEMPAAMAGKPGDEKKDGKAAVPTKESTSNAASEILKRYMRRPR